MSKDSTHLNRLNADLIIHNAKVYTVNHHFDIAESFAIKNRKFIAIGSNQDILQKYTSNNIINLKGKSVFPGFIDAHCHFYYYGTELQTANLVHCQSFDEVIEKVKAHSKKTGSEWILGTGWDQNKWKDKTFPNKEKLDKLFPDRPVVLKRVDAHALLVNSEALKRAGITKETIVDGGKIQKKDGRLTGILVDLAIDKVWNVLPKANKSSKTTALLDAQQKYFEVGITTVDEAGLTHDIISLIDELHKSNELKMRIYAMLRPTENNIEYFIKKGSYKTDYLNVRSIKMLADGALGSRGAKLLAPYSDDHSNHGLFTAETEQLRENCALALKYNYQMITHAIGDAANKLMLEMYGEFLKGENELRWRIEHAQIVAPEDFHLYKKYSVIPSVQTTHATTDMFWAEKRIGAKRLKYAYAYKTLLNQNGWIANGSDFPVEHINPIYGFYAAVTRRNLSFEPKDGFQIEEALNKQEALKAMTIWAAKSNFEENEKGSIEIEKFADFVVLDQDIMTIDPREIPKTKVLKTFIGGEQVHTLG